MVHEFLNQLGGAEKVLQNFLEIWPDADVHVILYDEKKTQGEFEFAKKKISWLNKFPLAHKHPRLYLTLMPAAVESFSFEDYDVIFSDSSSFAKGAKANGKLHICYCHTPTRFLWTEPEYLNYQKYPSFMKSLGKLFMPWLKKWDFRAAQRPDFFIANSVNVQNRIKKFYNRDSVVIAPPVDTDFFQPGTDKRDFFLTVTRLEPYKKVDVLIEAFNQLGLPLKIVGTGTVESDLKKFAKPNVEFLGRVDNLALKQLYAEAKAFVFAAEEDAGIVFAEAQASGTPVIAYGKGGALESVIPGKTGELFQTQTALSLAEVLKNFNPAKYNPEEIKINAERFSKNNFQNHIKNFVEEKYLAHSRNAIRKAA